MDKPTCREIIDTAFRQADAIGYIINQSPGELAEAADEMDAVVADVVLEIGCQHGGFMFAVRPFCSEALTYIAVDPAFSTGWPIYSARLRESGVDVREIRATSQAALARVKDELDGRAVDVLHIDGSHVAADALYDFDTYSPLVRAGGLVLMHDVCGSQGPADTLATILHSDRVKRIASHRVVCDTMDHAPRERMGVAVLKMA